MFAAETAATVCRNFRYGRGGLTWPVPIVVQTFLSASCDRAGWKACTTTGSLRGGGIIPTVPPLSTGVEKFSAEQRAARAVGAAVHSPRPALADLAGLA